MILKRLINMIIDKNILNEDLTLLKKNKKSFIKYNGALYNNLVNLFTLLVIIDKILITLEDYKTNDFKVDFDNYFNNILILVNDIFVNIYKLKSFIINDFEYTC